MAYRVLAIISNSYPLPKEALNAFLELKKRLITDPVVANPRSDRRYVLITDASTGTDKIVGGFGAILTQVDEKGNYHVIAYGSRQLRDHELNYSPYLAEMAAAKLGYGIFRQLPQRKTVHTV